MSSVFFGNLTDLTNVQKVEYVAIVSQLVEFATVLSCRKIWDLYRATVCTFSRCIRPVVDSRHVISLQRPASFGLTGIPVVYVKHCWSRFSEFSVTRTDSG